MKREWKAGDVAMVRIPKKSAPGFSVTESGVVDIPAVANRGGGWSALSDVDYFWDAGYSFHGDAPRPLVVIDPEDREQVERLLDDYWERVSSDYVLTVDQKRDAMQAALREFANPTPPKPDEPSGLGAVVEDAGGYRWVRDGQMRFWTREEREPVSPLQCEYADIDAVRVLSEGWSE